MNSTNYVATFIHIGPGCKHQDGAQIAPTEPDVGTLLKLAKSDLDSGLYDQAIQKLGRYLTTQRDCQEALRLRAYAFRQTGNSEAALEDLNLLVKLGWNSPELHLCLAEVYCAQNLKNRAKDELHKALRAPGLTIEDCIVTACAFWEIEELEIAVKLIKRALAVEQEKQVRMGTHKFPANSKLVQDFQGPIPPGLLLKITSD